MKTETPISPTIDLEANKASEIQQSELSVSGCQIASCQSESNVTKRPWWEDLSWVPEGYSNFTDHIAPE